VKGSCQYQFIHSGEDANFDWSGKITGKIVGVGNYNNDASVRIQALQFIEVNQELFGIEVYYIIQGQWNLLRRSANP